MIIDIHSHIAYHKLYPAAFLDEITEDIKKEIIQDTSLKEENSILKRILLSNLNDLDCSRLIKQMDQASIDKSILLIPDLGYALGEAKFSFEEIHKSYYDISKKYPERFIIFSGIDPRRGQQGYDQFEKSITEYGFKGLKLYPPCGFQINDPTLFPYYEICNKFGLPVLIHTGKTLKAISFKSKYPDCIIEAASKFKNVNFILGHAGARDHETGIMLARENDNIYLDISSFQTDLKAPELLKQKFESLAKNIAGKILFGTDWPIYILSGDQKKWVDSIVELNVFSDENLDR
ncbi:MAG: amidohydrolase family protein, partial [Ruminiclostridium sp.]